MSTERKKRSVESKSTMKRDGGDVILEISEMLINFQRSIGSYHAEKFYGHVVVKPKEELIIRVPVTDLDDMSTIREVIQKIQKEVIDGIDAQIKLREGRGTGLTQVTEIGDVSHIGEMGIQSVVSGEESQF